MTEVWVVDYPGRRKEGAVSDLRLEEESFDLRYLLTGYGPLHPPEAGYLNRLFEQTTGRPDVVIGYCMASTLAYGLAGLVERATARRPATVVLDESDPSDESVADAISSCLRQMTVDEQTATQLSSEALRRLQKSGESRCSALLEVEERLWTAARQALAEDGVPTEETEAIAEQLVATHIRWLTHLAGALDAAGENQAGPVLRLSSGGSEPVAAVSRAPAIATLAVAVPAKELLRSRAVGQEIAGWLRRQVRG